MATIRKRFGKWQIQIRRKNYPQIIKSFKEKSTATKYAREIELKMDKQQFEDYSNAASTTLKDILTRYRDEITPKKKGAQWETYKLNLLIRHKISSLSLLHLNPSALYSLKDELSKNRKPGTVKHYFSFISNAWNTAERVWGINLPPKNPIKYVTLDKVYDKRDRILSEEEYKKLLDSASVSNLRILKDVIIFAYQTAMRFGEILRLNRKDVDLNKRLIILRDTKNGEDRTIPISNLAVEILRKYPFGDKYFIIKRDQFRHYFEQACKRAEINNFRFHDLRACAITNMLLSGMLLPEVALISGHKTWSQLSRYTRIKAEHLLDKINFNQV
jgi:integrase